MGWGVNNDHQKERKGSIKEVEKWFEVEVKMCESEKRRKEQGIFHSLIGAAFGNPIQLHTVCVWVCVSFFLLPLAS